MAKAHDLSGIRDVDDPFIEEPLRHLLRSLNSEAQLTESGAAAMERRILHTLSERLRMFRDLMRHPEIGEQEIRRPLILTGGGRTGSTKLHKLLAASGDFKFMTFWQAYALSLRKGERSESPEERIREAEEFIKWFDERAPRARMIHPYDAYEPEEETHIYEKSVFGPMFCAFAFLPSFLEWYAKQDVRAEILFFRRALQYLQWQFYDGDTRPWILKYPPYQGFEPLLREAFPDATLVATHRDPVASLTSSCSLVAAYYEAYSRAPKNSLIGPLQLAGLAIQHQKLIEGRRENAKLNVLDVGYTELVRAPESVIERVYRHSSMNLGSSGRDAMRRSDQKHRQHQHGVHKHTLEEFSLTRPSVEQRFRPYVQEFSRYF
jgi:hypothetical protein